MIKKRKRYIKVKDSNNNGYLKETYSSGVPNRACINFSIK